MGKRKVDTIHAVQLAYAVAGGIITFKVVDAPQVWYLYFPFITVAIMLCCGAVIEIAFFKFLLRRKAPIYALATLVSAALLLIVSFAINSPLQLPKERIRVAVVTMSPSSSGESFTNRLVFALQRARSRGLPIEVREIPATVIGTNDRQQEQFAVRIGRSAPISAHIVVWGTLIADAPPFHSTVHVTFANNPFKNSNRSYRGAPWLEVSSIEGKDHPQFWPITTSESDSASTLENLLQNQTITIEELVEFLGGLALLDAARYSEVRSSIPPKAKSFNLRYLRTVALLEESIDRLAVWFENRGDFIAHLPPPDSVTTALRQSISEFDTLLAPHGLDFALVPRGTVWYAYYTRARAKEILMDGYSFIPEADLIELRDLYGSLMEAARESNDTVPEVRAFLQYGGYQFMTADSTSRKRIIPEFFKRLMQIVHLKQLPPELRALAYLRLGELCASDEWNPPPNCAVDAYSAGARVFHSSSALLGEAAIHRATGKFFSSSLHDHGRAATEYTSALVADYQSQYANIGTREEDAWFYLNEVAAIHGGEIPGNIAQNIYSYIMRLTFGRIPRSVHGAGDLLLQEALTDLKFQICDNASVNPKCWQEVYEHTNALMNSAVGVDDKHLASLYATHAFALWQLIKSNSISRRDRELYQSMIHALSYNNKAGGVSGVIHRISRIYREMLMKRNNLLTADAEIMSLLRSQCAARGTYLIQPNDSLGQHLFLVFPGDSAAPLSQCPHTSLATNFTPLDEVFPVPIIER